MFCLPKDTQKYMRNIRQSNFALYLNKFSVRLQNGKISKLPEPQITNADVYSSYYNSLKQLNLQTESFELSVSDKLVIGLGAASVYEVSITLHHIYGLPYIPASTIKGSLRSYLITEFFDKKEERALETDWFQAVFGTETKRGGVYFFDAFAPKGNFSIHKDIMNSHYPNYYSGSKPPTDTQNPNPVKFFAIRGRFNFFFGVKKDFKLQIGKKEISVLQFVKSQLQNSLKQFGIGAKTSVGYGYFI
jgi:CRISPR-associated protein Cmr6